MNEVKYPEVEVQLVGNDGNAFAIIGAVTKALKREAHIPAADVAAYTAEAMSGDYDHLLATTMRWVTVT